ncbi:MAG: IclR family transcriptional regulator C-terminal domain-containing protein [Casimicrobiaceae bacterium]
MHQESQSPGQRDAEPGVSPGISRTTSTGELQALDGDPDFMRSLARGLAVIRGFAEEQRPMSIAQLSQKTGIPRAAVRRCLYTLEQLGYVAAGNGGVFQLRPKLMSLGYAFLSSTPLTASAQPYLDRVSDAVAESCSLATLDRDDILYVARSVASRIISVSLNVGSRLPAHCTSIGYVLLAELVEQDLAAYLARVELRAYTERTVTSRKMLRETLLLVRRQGYAIADQQLERGVISIAVPVRNMAGVAVAGINVITQSTRGSPRELKARFLPELQKAAREIGAQLPP